MGVYSLKELEKLLPSVASIHQAQVKEYIQNLTDENQIRVEKIGSGNWYWSFLSDAKKAKENVINGQKVEENKLTTSIADTERQIEEELAKREQDEEEMLEGNGMDRKALLENYETLIKEMEGLDTELATYSDNDPTEMLRKQDETKKAKEDAIRWTDHLESLESYLVQMTGDRAKVADLMGRSCGEEYVVGEGLREL